MIDKKKKRQNSRLKAQWLLKYEDVKTGAQQTANIRNLSGTGLMFESSLPMVEGTDLTITLNLPFADEAILTRAKIVRCARPKNSHNRYHIGVNFIGLSSDHEKLIQEHIKEISNTSLGDDFIQP